MNKCTIKTRCPVTLARTQFIISKRNISQWTQDRKYWLKPLSKIRIRNVDIIKRALSTSSKVFNENKNAESSGGDKNKGPEFEILRGIAIFILIYFVLNLLFNDTEKKKVEDMFYISWEEFKNDILAKGEVEKLIINMDTKEVGIVLHKGAVIKNKLVGSNYYFKD